MKKSDDVVASIQFGSGSGKMLLSIIDAMQIFAVSFLPPLLRNDRGRQKSVVFERNFLVSGSSCSLLCKAAAADVSDQKFKKRPFQYWCTDCWHHLDGLDRHRREGQQSFKVSISPIEDVKGHSSTAASSPHALVCDNFPHLPNYPTFSPAARR